MKRLKIIIEKRNNNRLKPLQWGTCPALPLIKQIKQEEEYKLTFLPFRKKKKKIKTRLTHSPHFLKYYKRLDHIFVRNDCIVARIIHTEK